MPPLEDDAPEHFDLESALLEDKAPDDSDSTPVKTNDKASLRDTLSRTDADTTSSADDDSTENEDAEEQEEAVEPVADEPEEVQDQATVDVFARAAAAGLDLKGKYRTAEEAVDGLLNAARLVGQRNHYAEYGKQLLENPQAVLESLQKLYQKKEEAAPEVKTSNTPEFNPEWIESFDEEGKLRPGADPTIPAKLKKYNDYVRDRATKFATEPEKELLPLFREELKKLAKEQATAIVKEETDRIRQENERAATFQAAERLVQEESAWAFVDGDIRKGPTAEGKVLGKWLQVLETPDAAGNIPIPDMRMRKEVAVMMARNEIAATKPAQQTQATSRSQQKITKKPNRAATEPTDKTWPKGLSLDEALARAFEK